MTKSRTTQWNWNLGTHLLVLLFGSITFAHASENAAPVNPFTGYGG